MSFPSSKTQKGSLLPRQRKKKWSGPIMVFSMQTPSLQQGWGSDWLNKIRSIKATAKCPVLLEWLAKKTISPTHPQFWELQHSPYSSLRGLHSDTWTLRLSVNHLSVFTARKIHSCWQLITQMPLGKQHHCSDPGKQQCCSYTPYFILCLEPVVFFSRLQD